MRIVNGVTKQMNSNEAVSRIPVGESLSQYVNEKRGASWLCLGIGAAPWHCQQWQKSRSGSSLSLPLPGCLTWAALAPGLPDHHAGREASVRKMTDAVAVVAVEAIPPRHTQHRVGYQRCLKPDSQNVESVLARALVASPDNLRMPTTHGKIGP
jgi:hypothetical protein